MKKLFLISAVIMLVIALILGGCAQPAPAPAPAPKPITLKAVTAWPLTYQNNAKFIEWVKKANEQGKGQFVIDVVGGPEAIPLPEQVGALKKGVVDLLQTAAGYYTGEIPEVFALTLSKLTPTEERQKGFYDLMAKIHAEKGLFYLGRTQGAVSLGYVCVSIPVKSPKDLKGLKIRSVAIYDPLVKEVGAVPVTMPVPDIYNAMQQRVIDGFISPIMQGYVGLGFHEVAKYIIDEPFYQLPGVVMANADSWNKLPENSRKLLMDTFIEMEKTVAAYWKEVENAEFKKARDAGVNIVKFSAEDSKWFNDAAYRLGWEATLPKTPQYGAKLRELSSK